MQRYPLLIIAYVCFSFPTLSQEAIKIEAHEHGVGQLRIAVDGATIAIEFEASGADIVGFEHVARSASDREKVQASIAILAKPLTLFAPPKAAQCRVAKAEIELFGDEGTGKHDADHHEEPKSLASHSEFHGDYRLICSNPAAITSIDFRYFEAFPNAQELKVLLVTDKGASAYEVERDKPRIDLTGIM